jgi:3-oxoadipate enol-lactonase
MRSLLVTTLVANNIKINYRLDPCKDGAKNAPVVMLSNSLLSSYPMWDDQIDALTEDYQVLRYDTRGHGETDAPVEPYSIEMFVADVVGLLDELGITKVHFVGLSMGGFIGQLFAASHPDRVLSLVLCDTACVMPPASLWNERIEMAEKEGVDALINGTLQRWFTASFHKTDMAAIDKIRAMIKATGVQGYVNCSKAIRDMNQCHILGDIKAPTVVIVGADDPACPVASAETLHNGIAGSRLVILEEAAHLPNIEKKTEFNAALLGFLKEQPQ